MVSPNTPSNPDKAKNPAAMDAMFSRIVRWYDPLNRILSLGFDQKWRKKLATEAVTPSKHLGHAVMRVGDFAAGTLDVTMALSRHPAFHKDAQIVAVDVCPAMMLAGRNKIARSNAYKGKEPMLLVADAGKLPLPDSCLDSITMAFGIRNMAPRERVFAEMLRVLSPGGKACILEFSSRQNRFCKGLYSLYLQKLLPRFGRMFSGDGAYGYLARSIMDFPSADELAKEMQEAGFCAVRYTKLTAGIVALHVGEKGTDAFSSIC